VWVLAVDAIPLRVEDWISQFRKGWARAGGQPTGLRCSEALRAPHTCHHLWLSSRAPARKGSITTRHDGVSANRVSTTASLRAISHQAYVRVDVLRHWHAPTSWILLRINLRYGGGTSQSAPAGGRPLQGLAGGPRLLAAQPEPPQGDPCRDSPSGWRATAFPCW
jgi:hypothetical protein